MRTRLAGLFFWILMPNLLSAVETNLILSVDGVTYSNVTWGAVSPAAVTAFHSSGIAKLPLEKLSPDLQKSFDYDPKRAAVYRQAEEKAEAASHLDRNATSSALNKAIAGYSFQSF